MLHITFNSIRSEEAGYYGYDILSNYLGGDINYGMDKPISLIKCLESNPIEDVIWALKATLEDSKEFSKQFAIACAEHVLPIFEKEFPEDKRPREALEAAKAGKLTKEILKAAHFAAEAAYLTASTAAYAASRAAYYAAYAAAYYAAAAAADAATNYAEEKQWQKELLIKLLSKH